MSLNYNVLNNMEKQFGESFYILDSNKFSDNFDEFLGEFAKIYPKTNIGYSYKTNYTPKLCKIIDQKGAYAEVVSTMEYDLAIKIGVEPKNIIVNGPYKNKEALEKFLLNGSNVNVDSYREAELVEEIANENKNKNLSIGLRCNFDIDNGVISRFGFDVEDEKFYKLFDRLNSIKNISLKGIHCHFPDRNLESYTPRVEKILELADKLFDEAPEYIDVGGGYFGRVEESLQKQFSTRVPEYKEYAEVIATVFKEHYKDLDDDEKPTLLLEPGSALVGDAMQFIAKVLDIKTVREKNIALTSGSKFNIGLLTSSVNMPMEVFSNTDNRTYYDDIDIAGFTCIESDYLFKNYSGDMDINDYLVFSNVGSYSIVFKPQFILPNVPVIEYNDKDTNYEIIKRQETVEDVFSTFII
jgi:diaminopimelate decarboxylase